MTRGRPRVLPHPCATAWTPPPEVLRQAGACASNGEPDLFYDDDRQDAAVIICTGCPVRDACLAYAIDHEEYGVWGGVTAQGQADMRGTTVFPTPSGSRLDTRHDRRQIVGHADGVGATGVPPREPPTSQHGWKRDVIWRITSQLHDLAYGPRMVRTSMIVSQAELREHRSAVPRRFFSPKQKSCSSPIPLGRC